MGSFSRSSRLAQTPKSGVSLGFMDRNFPDELDVAVLSTALGLAVVRLHRNSAAIPASPSSAKPNSLRPPGYIISSNALETEIESPPRDARDDGQFAPVEIERQLRGLSLGCPRARDGRAFAQSTFIYENDGSAFAAGFFFSAGHVYRFQRAMAFSSRSAARPSGFWQLHPIRPKSFHTCAGWQRTPLMSWSVLATRGRVHRSLRNPCA